MALTSLKIGSPFDAYSFVGNSSFPFILNFAIIFGISVEADKDYIPKAKKFEMLGTLLVFLSCGEGYLSAMLIGCFLRVSSRLRRSAQSYSWSLCIWNSRSSSSGIPFSWDCLISIWFTDSSLFSDTMNCHFSTSTSWWAGFWSLARISSVTENLLVGPVSWRSKSLRNWADMLFFSVTGRPNYIMQLC